MSGEGTAPSKHGRPPQKDDMSGKPAGGETARAKATQKGTQEYKNKAGCIKGKKGGY